MGMKTAVGHVIYTPLSYVFSMLEKGGSSVQQFDSVDGEWEPDRVLTPYVLQPCLVVEDKDGVVQNGDVTLFMVNAIWSVRLIDSEGREEVIGASPSTYIVDDVNGHRLSLMMNCGMREKIVLRFSGDYYDARRGETQHFTWDKELVCEVQQRYNFNLTVDTPSKTLLSPFRNRDKIVVKARLMNGEDDVTGKADISWLWWTDGKFVDLQTIDDESDDVTWYPLWFDYYKGRELVVRQGLIQDIIIKCEARLAGECLTKVFRMKRWYGQWEESLDLIGGQFVRVGQTKAVANVTVSTRKDVLAWPEEFFDVEIFHSTDGETWESAAHGSYYEHDDADLTRCDHHFGCRVRELSAEMSLVLPDGSPLVTPQGEYLVVQVPV